MINILNVDASIASAKASFAKAILEGNLHLCGLGHLVQRNVNIFDDANPRLDSSFFFKRDLVLLAFRTKVDLVAPFLFKDTPWRGVPVTLRRAKMTNTPDTMPSGTQHLPR